MPAVKLNDQSTAIPTVLVGGRTYVRARDLVEAMGAAVVREQEGHALHVITILSPAVDLDLRFPSNVAAAPLDRMLAGTGLAGLGESFVAAEANYRGPNALIMAAHAALETGWGTSWLSRERNNLFGIGAWDGDPGGAARYPSKEACIDWYASYVTREYLHPAGKYHSGPTLQGMNRYWATDPNWAAKIAGIAADMLKEVGLGR